jgi:hypothetical protein
MTDKPTTSENGPVAFIVSAILAAIAIIGGLLLLFGAARLVACDAKKGDTAEGHTVADVRTDGDQVVLTDEDGKERRYWRWQEIRGEQKGQTK